MGSFRSQPDTVKHSNSKTENGLNYAVSHMCGNQLIYLGWRIYMEDAHINLPTLPNDKKNSLFAVFDGHGGNRSSI